MNTLNCIGFLCVIVSIFVGTESIRFRKYDTSLELAPTPAGYIPKECIHEVPSHSNAFKESNGSIRVVKPDGTVEIFPACPFAENERRQVDDNGWIAYGVFFWN